ncbi:MAG: hypothetical protein OEQ13_08230 [Acidobacteriota bacterium]|nr:hypothetical protein [Acidobacteriota bacterium]
MLSRLGIEETQLLRWIEDSRASGSNLIGRGYQSNVYLFERGDTRLAVKTVAESLSSRLLCWRLLRNELRAYSRLEGLPGIPRCYGLLDGRHLVLEHVDGAPFRDAVIQDREAFFEDLLRLVRSLHARGVAHCDLKKKDNLLVVDGRAPCVIDFGVAISRKDGFAPLNHYWYRLARTFDYNAWAKLKYEGRLENASAQDLALVHRTAVERVANTVKMAYLRVRGKLGL